MAAMAAAAAGLCSMMVALRPDDRMQSRPATAFVSNGIEHPPPVCIHSAESFPHGDKARLTLRQACLSIDALP